MGCGFAHAARVTACISVTLHAVLFCQNFSRVHNACRIKGLFDAAHEIYLDGRADMGQLIAFQLTNAMFGGNRPGMGAD
ncbi:MAG: hypothetical protein RIR97_925, partial [Pseudomonadota bacterium]